MRWMRISFALGLFALGAYGASCSSQDASKAGVPGGGTDASASPDATVARDASLPDGAVLPVEGDGGSPADGAVDASVSPPLETLFPDAQFDNAMTGCGAKGDGVTDDTSAINKCLEAGSVFFPAGTYLVSDTLVAPNAYRTYQGENRDTTIIRLKDDAGGGFASPDAAGGDAKPVILTVDDPDTQDPGNEAFDNFIINLTIDTGSGNPNAAGINFHANNEGAIRSVVVKSEDGAGRAGIDLAHDWPGPSLIEYLEVDGFDYGILSGEVQYGVTFEHISLKGQNLAGVANGGTGGGGYYGNVLTFRDLVSVNSVPAVISAPPGFITLLGASLTGGDSGVAAIVNTAPQGSLYLENVSTAGYMGALSNRGQLVTGSTIASLIDTPDGGPFSSFAPTPTVGLGLPVEETPFFHDNDLSNWQDVGAPNGVDDTASIQAALSSGKSTVYFHGEHGIDGTRTTWYRVSGTLHVPATVKRVVGMQTFITQVSGSFASTAPLAPVFRIEDGAAGDQVFFEQINVHFLGTVAGNAIVLDDASPRTLVVRDVSFGTGYGFGAQPLMVIGYSNEPGAGPVFFSDVAGLATFPNPQTVWMRHYNNESAYSASPAWDHTVNAGGTLWILGFKTEKAPTVLETTDGGRSEVFGGFLYTGPDVSVHDPDAGHVPTFIVNDSRASLSFVEQVDTPDAAYTTYVQETQAGVTRSFAATAAGLPRSSKGGYDVPLYVTQGP